MKKLTLLIAILWLVGMTTYSSLLIGTLAHELTHKAASMDMVALKVNYDTSGSARGSFYRHSHDRTYLNGMIVETSIIAMNTLAIFIILGAK